LQIKTFISAVSEVFDEISKKFPAMKFFNCSEEINNNSELFSIPLYHFLQHYPKDKLDFSHEINFEDKMCYIFTSGTTGGKPKAAIVTHARTIMGAHGHKSGFRFKTEDNFYIPLPLYHSFPGLMPVGQCLVYGNTITIAEKFSASKFWNDCIKFNCTVRIGCN
jgi:solute carrier family 27 fatty acid transporter 1/4